MKKSIIKNNIKKKGIVFVDYAFVVIVDVLIIKKI